MFKNGEYKPKFESGDIAICKLDADYSTERAINQNPNEQQIVT